MRTNSFLRVLLSFVCLVSFLGFSKSTISEAVAVSAPDEAVVSETGACCERETVNVASKMEYRVRWGDTLFSLAKRYNTTVEELVSLELNPKLANRVAERGNTDLIYAGETIVVPVYTLAVREIETVAPNELLVLPAEEVARLDVLRSAILEEQAHNTVLREEKTSLELEKTAIEHETEVAALRAEQLEGQIKQYESATTVFSVVVLMLVFLALCIGLVLEKIRKKKIKDPLFLFTNEAPPEILEILKTANGSTLTAMNDLPIASDERGNPVTLKKLREFIEKRPYLSDIPVREWHLYLTSL